jgi:hypothetical protein
VDARSSAFNEVHGSQYNLNQHNVGSFITIQVVIIKCVPFLDDYNYDTEE